MGGDLIRLLAAYNAGPGNLARWLPVTRHRDDPFLFIEAIPIEETRLHVQRVLAYSWIYASRLGPAGAEPGGFGPWRLSGVHRGRGRCGCRRAARRAELTAAIGVPGNALRRAHALSRTVSPRRPRHGRHWA